MEHFSLVCVLTRSNRFRAHVLHAFPVRQDVIALVSTKCLPMPRQIRSEVHAWNESEEYELALDVPGISKSSAQKD